MEKKVFEKPEDVVTSMHTGDKKQDLETINAVLSGNIVIGSQEDANIIPQQTESTPVEGQPKVEDDIQSQPVVDPLEDEIERQKRYTEMLEKRRREEYETYLREKQDTEKKLNEERKNREELEKRLQELEQLKKERPSENSTSIDDDEEYQNEYTKRTRRMIEELKQEVGYNNPAVQQLIDKVNRIETEYETEKAERKKFQDQKKQNEDREKFLNGIRQFLINHSEIKPSRDITEIDEDYKRFRQDIAYLSKAQSVVELERAIDDYKKNGKIKELADQNGIKPVQDLATYDLITELVDFKDGVKYDSSLGKHVPILDENGVQVRYRSLDEAFNVKNYYENLTNSKRQAYRDVSAKLEQINNAPVVLKDEQLDSFSTGLTVDQEQEIINMHPKEWINNPEKKKLVELVYNKRGLEIPKYRGR